MPAEAKPGDKICIYIFIYLLYKYKYMSFIYIKVKRDVHRTDSLSLKCSFSSIIS